MTGILSCDWGTTSCRLRLVDPADSTVIAEEKSPQGIAATYQQWKQTGKSDREERLHFYSGIIGEHIAAMETRAQVSLDEVPIVISGMASASIGMMELPYSQLPFPLDGSGANTTFIESTPGFNHPVLLISGVQSEDDVMRGEETQLTGYIDETGQMPFDGIFILPGTHSKHIYVQDRRIVYFKTYMTGEFFELLTTRSILHANVEKPVDPDPVKFMPGFQKAVQDSVNSNILHTCFRARTNDLFQKSSKQENYFYISGLLIGTELKDLISTDDRAIYLVGGAGIHTWYEAAFEELGMQQRLHIVPAEQADNAVIKGQLKIFHQFNGNK